ncbi:MAG: phosphate ABC transporter permease PstA [Armatimonadota bacterium]|nr:phosphate ABC transporter permease PstA [Armatimonadota bacterium]MDR7436214.1 phosphate ABC transporter permease PstA [Armatimonadota bacterium]MDR7471405.1 phosphate ABC transporter permease PstA [Armatimonadota bacterium]MDR7509544.1 phosphate ABC transporter permease PstA [Armatimonadota bacterium]MDR7516598.1 phosphate ABC transporter permease PstA [Armatimonadota bacterium]
MTAVAVEQLWRRRLERRKAFARLFVAACQAATVLGLVFLATLLVDVARDGAAYLRPELVTNFPSRFPHQAGYASALVGTLYVAGLMSVVAFPLGVAAAVYLEEYAPPGRLARLLEVNIANLAAIPSVLYGLLGLGLFVEGLRMGKSVLAGALTLTLLVLPLTILSSREAIRAVPFSVREAAYALGATRWQVVRHHVLPYASSGILTGTILSLSRAVGETAPLIMLGALQYVPFLPRGVWDYFTVLPIQIFNYVSLPNPEFHRLAAAGILVLLAVLLVLNGAAIGLRNRACIRW